MPKFIKDLFKYIKRSKLGLSGIGLIFIIVVMTTGAAYAAWAQTQQVAGTSMVLGTFSVAALDCEDTIPDQVAKCRAAVTNNYDEAAQIDNAVLVADREDIAVFGDWSVEGRPGVNVAQPIAVGESLTIVVQFRPQAGAPVGPINWTMDVTASSAN